MTEALPQTLHSYLDTVSTARGSGWVRRRRARLSKDWLRMHPPATAGGTDCVQVLI